MWAMRAVGGDEPVIGFGWYIHGITDTNNDYESLRTAHARRYMYVHSQYTFVLP